MTDQLLNDAFSARNGDRKANALSFAVNGRVDADQFAFDVEQRAAGIAGINRGIGLDEIVVRSPISVKRAIQGADDAGGHPDQQLGVHGDGVGGLEPEGVGRVAGARDAAS